MKKIIFFLFFTPVVCFSQSSKVIAKIAKDSALGGVAISGIPQVGQVPFATSATTAVWANLPSNQVYFFRDSAADIAGAKQMRLTTAPAAFDITTAGVVDLDTLATWATIVGKPGAVQILAGAVDIHVHAAKTGGSRSAFFKVVLYEYSAAGNPIALIGVSGTSSELDGVNTPYALSIALGTDYTLASTASRVVAKIVATTSGGGSAPTVAIYYGLGSSSYVAFTPETGSGSGSGADPLGTYLVQTATNAPANAQILGALGTGLVKNTTGTGVQSIAVPNTDYLTPTGSAAGLTSFPILNQNTTGNAATVTTNANLSGPVTSTGNATAIAAGAISNAMLANGAVANLSGINSGNDAANTIYANDYRAANFVAGTNYLTPTGLATGLTGILTSGAGGTGINNGGRTLTINTNSGTLAFSAAAKTLTIANTLTFSGTDASTLNIGTGGTLGTNAYTSTAFAALVSPVFTTPRLNSTSTLGYVWTATDANGNGSFQIAGAASLAIGGSISGGTAGRVLFENSSNQLGQDAGLTFGPVTQTLALLGTDAGLLLKSVTTEPPTPAAGNVELYAASVASRAMLKVKGPSGLDYPLQPSLMTNGLKMISPASAALPNLLGFQNTFVGTASHPVPTSTNYRTGGNRWIVTSATTSNSASEGRTTAVFTWLGNAANLGGFTYATRFGVSTTTTNQQVAVGLWTATTATSTTQVPSNLVNCIFTGWDAADANLQIMHNDASGACTKIDLGASFPTNNTSAVYETVFFSSPNSGEINYRVTRLDNNAQTSGTISTNLPSSTTFLTRHEYMNNGGTAAAVVLEMFKVYYESDY